MSQQHRSSSTYKSKAPSKHAMATVREAFDAEALIRICESEPEYFAQYAQRFQLPPTRDSHDRFYFYQDNGADILAVAHLDHVQWNTVTNVTETAAGLLVTSGALDDRLGAYVILEMLPKLGIKVDWLLTTDEECGASTAEDFETTKNYNWIIEFDRGGTDVVMYDYETKEYAELVENAGATMGIGSFSDICCLERLGCAAFNWGVGYADYHSARSHAWLEDTFRMVARFMKFYEQNADKYLFHEESPRLNFIDGWAVDEDELIEWGERTGYSEEFYATLDDDDDLDSLAQSSNEGLLDWLERRAIEDYQRGLL